MAKLDPNVFSALGEMLRIPSGPKKSDFNDREIDLDLNPSQQRAWDCDAPYLLLWGEKFSGKCRDGEALVYTDTGLRRLRRLAPKGAAIGANKIRQKVVSFDGENPVVRKATGFWIEPRKDGVRCELENGSEFGASKWHPLWVCAAKPNGEYLFGYFSMEEIEKKKKGGWRFWTPFVSHQFWDKRRGRIQSVSGIKINEDVAYLIGALIGDGCLGSGNFVRFTNADPACLLRVERALVGLGCRMKRDRDGRHDWSILPAPKIVPLVQAVGINKLSYHKRIPDVLIESPKRVIAAMLRGLFDTDGCVEKSGYVTYCTTSEALGRDIQDLLSCFGILCSRRRKKSASGRPTWNISITGRHAVKFGAEIGFEIQRKKDRIFTPKTSKTRPSGFNHWAYGYPDPIRAAMRSIWRGAKIAKSRKECYSFSRFRSFHCVPSREKVAEAMKLFGGADILKPFLVSHNWLEVDSIRPSHEDLFDLSVPRTHSFLASGTINHNTWLGVQIVLDHCVEYDNALGVILTRTGNMSTEGGAWHKLLTEILPEWEEQKGVIWKKGHDKQHNEFVWVLNRHGKWSMILSTSAPNPEQLVERFRGREPSIVMVDELTSCSTDDYFKAISAQLGRRPGIPKSAQRYIAATNPDDPEHWVYQRWFGEDGKGMGPKYVQFYLPKDENIRNVGEDYFTHLAETYKGDDAAYSWFVEGAWVSRPSGDGLFKDLFNIQIHVRPLRNDMPDPNEILRPHAEFPMIIGLDPGSVYNAFSFQQNLPVDGRQTWLLFDEMVTIKKRVSYEAFIPAVMRRMRWWMDEVEKDMGFVWISDNSAFNQYRAAQGSYDVLEIERIYEANRKEMKLPPLKIRACPKFNGSIVTRTRLGQKMLADRQILVSSLCRRTQKMFLALDAKLPKPGEPLDPDAALTPKRSDHIHLWDAVSYPWLAGSLNSSMLVPSSTQSMEMYTSAA